MAYINLVLQILCLNTALCSTVTLLTRDMFKGKVPTKTGGFLTKIREIVSHCEVICHSTLRIFYCFLNLHSNHNEVRFAGFL